MRVPRAGKWSSLDHSAFPVVLGGRCPVNEVRHDAGARNHFTGERALMSTDAEEVTEVPAGDNGRKKGFDIAVKKQELAVEDEGVTFHVTDADDELAYGESGNPVTWTVCGMNSEAWRRAERWQEKKMREFGGRELTPSERAEIEAEFLARCSKGFTEFSNNGMPITFSTPNATLAILALPYLKRQIQRRMGNHSGFIKRASVNS